MSRPFNSVNPRKPLKPVVINFEKYFHRKKGFKKICRGCDYKFMAHRLNDCYCGTCRNGIKQYINTEINKAIISAWGGY